MEEVKEVQSEEGCGHHCMNMHKFCSKHYCVVRSIAIVVVLFGTFALGCAFGMHHGERFERQDDYRYGRHMMQFDGQSFRGGQNAVYYGNGMFDGTQTGYRMMGQPTSIQIQAVPATGAQPAQAVVASPKTVVPTQQ